jgi:hypothetical protein
MNSSEISFKNMLEPFVVSTDFLCSVRKSISVTNSSLRNFSSNRWHYIFCLPEKDGNIPSEQMYKHVDRSSATQHL